MRRSILSVLLAVIIGTAAQGGDLALEGVLARMAAQEALLNDMEAKVRYQSREPGAADGITSLRKNATVTVGGLVTTGYYYQKYKKNSVYDNPTFTNTGVYRRRGDSKSGSLEISDAELFVDIQVNDHFDAFLFLDLHNATGNDYASARAYWIRWKNICNTGFGIKVGRDDLVFGAEGYGYLDSWAAGSGDGISWLDGDLFHEFGQYGNIIGGTFFGIGAVPMHNGWKRKGVTQITPYWEGLDGKLLAEVSFMQNIDSRETRLNHSVAGSSYVRRRNGGAHHYRSKNDGLGTMSGRLTWTPVEDLKLTGSIVNYYNKATFVYAGTGAGQYTAHNNTAISLAFDYRPCFLSQLNLWGQWIHGWNVANFDGMDSDVVNAGASWDFTDKFTVFAQGDWLRSKFDFTTFQGPRFNNRGTGWAAYAGAMYSFDNGVVLEGGWRHENIKYKEDGVRVTKFTGDTIYATIGFEF